MSDYPETPMKMTREWMMIEDLYSLREEFDTEAQRVFIEDMHAHVDPYAPFKDQMVGLENGEPQERWLYSLWERYINLDEDAANEIYEDTEP